MTTLINNEQESSSNDRLLKDVPKEYQKLFINNFKKSCLEAAVNGAGEDARGLMERFCTCGADKALEVVTLEDAIKIEQGDKQVEQRVIKAILGQMSDCIVSQ